jgi:hypothetical protein
LVRGSAQKPFVLFELGALTGQQPGQSAALAVLRKWFYNRPGRDTDEQVSVQYFYVDIDKYLQLIHPSPQCPITP